MYKSSFGFMIFENVKRNIKKYELLISELVISFMDRMPVLKNDYSHVECKKATSQ